MKALFVPNKNVYFCCSFNAHNENLNNVKFVLVCLCQRAMCVCVGDSMPMGDSQLPNNNIPSNGSLCIMYVVRFIMFSRMACDPLVIWTIILSFYVWKNQIPNAQSPFNEQILMTYRKWNLSRMTITTTTIQFKCLLLSPTRAFTHWLSVYKMSKQTKTKQKKPTKGQKCMANNKDLAKLHEFQSLTFTVFISILSKVK